MRSFVPAVILVLAAVMLSAGSARLRAQQSRDGPGLATGVTTVTGTVVADDTGRPVARVLVTLKGIAPAFARVASTDTGGRFTFTGLPSGDVTITATKTAYLTAYYGARDPIRGPAVPFTLSISAPRDIALRLVRGAVIAGAITGPTGRPQPGVHVAARRTRVVDGTRRIVGGPQGEGGVTDDLGRYRIWGLVPGDFVVEATPDDRTIVRAVSETDVEAARAGASGGRVTGVVDAGHTVRYAPVYYAGAIDAGQAAPVTLAAAEERDGIDLALRLVPTASLRGTVIDVDGRPAARLTVALDTPFGRVTTDSDDAGHFEFRGVAPGDLLMSARASSRRPTADSSLPGERWAAQDLSVTGDDQSGIVLALRPGMTASGRVVFQGPSAPVAARATIALTVAGDLTGSAMPAETQVAADGTFTLGGLAPGRYRVHAAILAPASPASSGLWLLKSVLWQGQDLLDGTLDVAPGENIDGLSVVFADRQTDLRGTFFDSAGHPVAGYDVVVFAADRRFWTAGSRRVQYVLLSRDGRFDFSNLPAGDYLLAAVTHAEPADLDDPLWLDGIAAMAIHTTLADGEHKVQDLRIGR